jgi:GntR family transcriptional regulator, transcriptional repressor for pyruvate dehydrogenase complex
MSLFEEEVHDSLHAVRRSHVADSVFDQLVAAILRGELKPGSAVPPERALAERFQTSRIMARQAIHRLDELGLVRVRQGGATVVLDPKDANDLRVLEIAYKLDTTKGPPPVDPRFVLEKQLLQGLSLVEVAARCATRTDLEELAKLTASLAQDVVDEPGYVAFEERFWRAVAAAGQNAIFVIEVGWWYRVLHGQPRAEARVPSKLQTRVAFYVELARRLIEDDAPVRFYLDAVEPLLTAIRNASKPSKSSSRHRPKTTKPRRSR